MYNMKNKIFYTLVSLAMLFTSFNVVASSLNSQAHTYAMLLSSGDSEKIRMAAKLIYHYDFRNKVLLDIAAEVLYQGGQNKIDIRTDSMSWLAKLLGRSEYKRYIPVLTLAKQNMQKLEEKTSEEGAQREFKFAVGFETKDKPGEANVIEHSKTLNYIEDSIGKLTVESSQTYSVGDIDLGNLKTRLNQTLIASSKKRTEDKFLNITSRYTVDQVYNELGVPDSTRVVYYWYKRSRWAGGAWVPTVLSTDLEIKYKKLGTITLSLKDLDNPLVVKSIITTIVYKQEEDSGQSTNNDTKSEEIDEKKELIRSLRTSYEPNILSRLGWRIYHEKLFDVEILDELMRRVYGDMDANNSMVGAYTVFLKCIGASGNTKYIPKLQTIMNDGGHRRVKNWAEKAIEMLGGKPKVNEEAVSEEDEF